MSESSQYGCRVTVVIVCRAAERQVLLIAQAFSQPSTVLSCVFHLKLSHLQHAAKVGHQWDEWLHLLCQFSTIQMLHVSQDFRFAWYIAFVLEDITGERVVEVLPVVVSRPLPWWVLHGWGYIYIRIGLLLVVASRDCLAFVLILCLPHWLLVHVQCLMIRGCISMSPPSFLIRVCAPGGLCLLITCTSTRMVVCIPWWIVPYTFATDSSPHVCWCSMGFLTIPLLLATVLGLRYFSYWYDNIGRCGL